jgi:hypothetical protein
VAGLAVTAGAAVLILGLRGDAENARGARRSAGGVGRAPDAPAARTTGWLERLFRRFNEWLIGLVAGVRSLHAGQTDEEYQELVELAFQRARWRNRKEIILQIISPTEDGLDVMKPRSAWPRFPTN